MFPRCSLAHQLQELGLSPSTRRYPHAEMLREPLASMRDRPQAKTLASKQLSFEIVASSVQPKSFIASCQGGKRWLKSVSLAADAFEKPS